MSPIEVRDRDAYLDPAHMTIDQAYHYILDGHEFIAVLQPDGSVDFFLVTSSPQTKIAELLDRIRTLFRRGDKQ